jgi:hypothetical protein
MAMAKKLEALAISHQGPGLLLNSSPTVITRLVRVIHTSGVVHGLPGQAGQ